MKNKKVLKYLTPAYRQDAAMLIIVIGLIYLCFYTTYGLYMKSFTPSTSINIPTDYIYDVGISEGTDFTLLSGEYKLIDVKVKGKSSGKIKCGVYYKIVTGSSNDVVVSQYVNASTDALLTDVIVSPDQIIKVPLYIKNNGVTAVTIQVGIKTEFINGTYSLGANESIVSTKFVRS